MLSEVAICNRALNKLGDQFIISLTDGTKPARACNDAYEPVRDALLRAHRWTFAMTRVQLAADATAPLFQYGKRYLLPTDCLRLDYIGDHFVGLDQSDYRNSPAAEYQQEGRYLLCNMTAPLNIRYIKRVTDSTQFDALFDEALACKLAEEMAITLTQSDALKESLVAAFRATLRTALRTQSIERAPEPLPDSSWVMSRI